MILNTNPGRRELLVFGGLLPLAVALFGFLLDRRFGASTAARWLWAVGAVVVIAYYVVPSFRRPIFLGWSYATYPIGWLISHVVLAVIWFGLMTPFGLALRVLRPDSMARKRDPSAPTYWAPHRTADDPRRYFQQF